MSLLHEMGYTNLAEYPGGVREWIEAGFPIEAAAGSPSREEILAGYASHAETKPVQIAPRVTPALAPARPSAMNRLLDRLESLSFGQLFGSWLGMVVLFGVAFYLLHLVQPALLELGAPLERGPRGLLVALYFSFVCATTIGFGDVVPQGIARGAAMAEAVIALLLFSCVVSKLVSRRQEELTEDIHRITTEHRLGRMQMNLHMVLSELYSVDGDERGLERLEGITMIFASELKAVHDLLFRPQHLPDSVLESLLARVASGLTELANKLERLPEGATCTGPFRATLKQATATAVEICGDCVPRAHAPGVKAAMDRVQQQGMRLSGACDALA